MRDLISAFALALVSRSHSRTELELELFALRHQLSVLRRQRRGRPRLSPVDRLLWVWLYRIGPRCLHVLRVNFYSALSRAGLRRVTFHTLRHSCASAMIASGAPISEVQHRLGHANPAITLQVYSHFFTHGESAATKRLAEFVLGNPGSATESRKSGHFVGTRPGSKMAVAS